MSAPAEIGAPRRVEQGRRRTAARLAAVQALYQVDLAGAPPATVVAEFVKHRLCRDGRGEGEDFGVPDEKLFADVVEGACARRDDVDPRIAAALSPDWPLNRLEVILRAILRAAAYELMTRPDVPTRVVISEYLDIAHAFFAGKEPGLVNGVLDRLARTLRSDGLRQEADDHGVSSR